jgi:hypothetical protein
MLIPEITYRHDAVSFAPAHLTAKEIWRIGSTARRQLFRYADQPSINVAELTARTRCLIVNELSIETHWDLNGAVTDNDGHAAFGCVHHDGGRTILVALNANLIGERDHLWRSTAAHELGHVIFDVPGWITNGSARSGPQSSKQVLMRGTTVEKSPASRVVDWPEWRAMEFMGALLAPPKLLAKHLQRKAVELGLSLTLHPIAGAPALDVEICGHDGIEAIVLELAELFGLSPSFIHVRLKKYRLVYSS